MDVITRYTIPQAIDAAYVDGPSPESSLPTPTRWARSASGGHGFLGRPTTDFVGWRRLHLEEIIQLQKDDFCILVIPSDAHDEDPHQSALRNGFVKRVVSCVAQSRPDIQRNDVLEFIKSAHGINRNDNVYIELPCYVSAYPNRDGFIADTIDEDEVAKLIQQGGGIGIRLLDHVTAVDVTLSGRRQAQSSPWGSTENRILCWRP